MTQNPLDLSYAISILEHGDYFQALKILTFLKESTLPNHPDASKIEQKYTLALSFLFDRNIIMAEELLRQEDETQTALHLLNLANLYEEINLISSFQDKNERKKLLNLAKLFEKWTLKVLSNIKSIELRKRHVERHFDEVLMNYGFTSLLFMEEFKDIIEKITKHVYNLDNFRKPVSAIHLEILSTYLDLGIKALKNENIIQAREYSQKNHLILDVSPDLSKFSSKMHNFDAEVLQVEADYHLKAGAFFAQEKNYSEASKNIKLAFHKYESAQNSSKAEEAKTAFLNISVHLARDELEQAQKAQNENDQENAINHYQIAVRTLERINAQKELKNTKELLQNYYISLGDQKIEEGNRISGNSPEEINHQLFLFHDAKEFYFKADSKKKFKKVNGEIINLQKQKVKYLAKEIQFHKKNKNYDQEFILLEEMHQLAYELDEQNKAKGYAAEIERIKSKIDYDNIEKLKEKEMIEKPWIKSKSNLIYQPPQHQIGNAAFNYSDPAYLISPQLSSSDPFIPNSNTILPGNANNSTSFLNNNLNSNYPAFPAPSTSQTIRNPIFNTSTTIDEDLVTVNRIVRHINQSRYLTKNDVLYLQNFGINLPEKTIYYHKYPDLGYQFYVLQENGKVILIPTKDLIRRKDRLGALANSVDFFFPTKHDNFIYSDILNDHLKFAINNPNWETLMANSQYFLERYLYFLHAVRLYLQNIPDQDIAHFFNCSLIENHIDIPTDLLGNMLTTLRKIKFIEEINSWTTNQNLRLLLIGLFYLLHNKARLACGIWSMMLIS